MPFTARGQASKVWFSYSPNCILANGAASILSAKFDCENTLLCYCAWSWKLVYSQLPLRWTRSGPAPTVRLREVSALEGDEVRQGPTPGVCFTEVSTLTRCSLRGSWLYSSLSERRKLQDHSVRKSMCQMPRPHGPDDADWLTDYLLY